MSETNAATLRTVAQVAEQLQCSQRTVWTLIQRGELHSIKVGRLRRISSSEVCRFIENGGGR